MVFRKDIRFNLIKLATVAVAVSFCSSSSQSIFAHGFVPPAKINVEALTLQKIPSTAISIQRQSRPESFKLYSYQHIDAHFEVETLPTTLNSSQDDFSRSNLSKIMALSPFLLVGGLALPAHAVSGGVLPSALWAYGHYFSIIAIFGILAVERVLVRTDMTVEDEKLLVKLDLGYGLLAALL